MPYPSMPNLRRLADEIHLYSQLQHERGADGIAPILSRAETALDGALALLRELPVDPAMAEREPDGLAAIRALRPGGPRRIWDSFDRGLYLERLRGALLGRFAGCSLGAPVEGWSVERMESWAREWGDAFPPRDYWTAVPEPAGPRYGQRIDSFTRSKMYGVSTDDDIAYTLLGLLIAEDHGTRFSTADVGEAWLKYLPYACTAEDIALRNLKKGIDAEAAAEIDNPFVEWIGADIRSDPWGYMAPGWPEFAAEMAYRDARISHRRNGVYGEMLFSAAIAAAFAVDDPLQAIEIGLSEIPADCTLAREVRWALEKAPSIRDYKEARAAVDERFRGMSGVHTINNACLTIWGIAIGGRDLTKVISETVAMGLDNDCTAATAGSIAGAVIGEAGIPGHWTAPFHDRVLSYLNGHPEFRIRDLVERFARQAEAALA